MTLFYLLAQEVSTDVPASIFNWAIGASGVIIAALTSAVIALWLSKGVTDQDRQHLAHLPILAQNAVNQTQIENLNNRLLNEQADRRKDIERLVGEQKDLMVGSLDMNNKLTTSLEGVKSALARVETALKEGK
jgi:hypothetical protein